MPLWSVACYGIGVFMGWRAHKRWPAAAHREERNDAVEGK